jgi:hypothetical protein
MSTETGTACGDVTRHMHQEHEYILTLKLAANFISGSSKEIILNS